MPIDKNDLAADFLEESDKDSDDVLCSEDVKSKQKKKWNDEDDDILEEGLTWWFM